MGKLRSLSGIQYNTNNTVLNKKTIVKPRSLCQEKSSNIGKPILASKAPLPNMTSSLSEVLE